MMLCYCVMIPLIFTMFGVVNGRIIDEPFASNECSPLMNLPLQEVAEKICELCHEFHSHEVPNMRAECRSECFSTDKFRMCMRMFTNAPKRHNRHSRRHLLYV